MFIVILKRFLSMLDPFTFNILKKKVSHASLKKKRNRESLNSAFYVKRSQKGKPKNMTTVGTLLPSSFPQLVNCLLFGAISFPLIIASTVFQVAFGMTEVIASTPLFNYILFLNTNSNAISHSSSLLSQSVTDSSSGWITWILVSLIHWMIEVFVAFLLIALVFMRRRPNAMVMNTSRTASSTKQREPSIFNFLGIGYRCQINPAWVFARNKDRHDANPKLDDGEEQQQQERPSIVAFFVWQLCFSLVLALSIAVFDAGVFHHHGLQSGGAEISNSNKKMMVVLRTVLFIFYSLFWLVLLGFWSGYDEITSCVSSSSSAAATYSHRNNNHNTESKKYQSLTEEEILKRLHLD